jgi:hypothetical protein
MMSVETIATDTWATTIRMLSQLPVTRLADRKIGVPRETGSQGTSCVPIAGLVVRVVERSTARRLTLIWRDPSRCAYGDQEWYQTAARRSGVCAVSGREIRRGELVFRPRLTYPKPVNADAMIHTAVFQEEPAS